MKNLARFLCFLLVLVLVFSGIFRVFSIDVPNTATFMRDVRAFYEEPENLIDVMVLGASSTYRYWNAMQAWEQAGVSSYAFAFASMNGGSFPYIIEEIRRTQDPQLYILDLRTMFKPAIATVIQRTASALPFWSVNRYNAINTLIRQNGKLDMEDRWDYYFDFVKFHGRWEEGLTIEDFVHRKGNSKGTSITAASFKLTVFDEPASKPTTKKSAMNETCEAFLVDLCEYLARNDLNALFVSTPFMMSESQRKQTNTAIEIIESYGFDCMNMNNLYDEIGIDFKTDLYNENHTNYYGMQKTTSYILSYLDENYDIPDRRKDPEYAENWIEAVTSANSKIKSNIKKLDKLIGN